MTKGYLSLKSLILTLVCIVFLNGCSSQQALPTATIYPAKTDTAASYNYLIGPGDQLNIFVWRNPEVSGSFVVRPDGKITTSLVEDIPASGKTPTQLARAIEERLATYLREPIVTVTISNFIGPYSEQIRVIGEAAQPRAVSYGKNMTLLDVMIAVGGLTEFADGNDAVLVRIENGKQKQYQLFIEDLIKSGNIKANIDVLPGDIIVIPEAWF
ncbi:polysaccharide export protein [Thalassotalea psychrophila]|uniref:Polysaccharide export protein n=1 Tax=Thalassotalea psychrophila TaxID=3065647 RepID=A0ABY9TVM4_9GAMM|nr:polysaccharide export protein [Colwelliaceae bacterium SQ149]